MGTSTGLEEEARELAKFLAEQGHAAVLSAYEAAEIINLSYGRTVAALNDRRLRGHRRGATGRWRVSLLDLARFLVGITPMS